MPNTHQRLELMTKITHGIPQKLNLFHILQKGYQQKARIFNKIGYMGANLYTSTSAPSL